MAEMKYEIKHTYGVLSESTKGWKKELNLISWNGRKDKFDLREWSADHDKMGKGVTFTSEELKKLRDMLNELEL
ncbi:YdbC family protein [Shimazuella kribbensis]|uniref:YdbC family protein n=1 Tax=Shimazuella kribbensis TaxID=139808 RepID=UPI0004097197|nr:PC4/YdbC family ssDNA-binding protein [Shimazuella kribbensis]